MPPRSVSCSADLGVHGSKEPYPPQPLRATAGLFFFTSLLTSRLHAAKTLTFALHFSPKIAWRKEVCGRQAEKQGGGAHVWEDLS